MRRSERPTAGISCHHICYTGMGPAMWDVIWISPEASLASAFWPAEDGLPEKSKSFIVSKGGNKSAVFMSNPFQSFVAHGWCVALLMLWVVYNTKRFQNSLVLQISSQNNTVSVCVFAQQSDMDECLRRRGRSWWQAYSQRSWTSANQVAQTWRL